MCDLRYPVMLDKNSFDNKLKRITLEVYERRNLILDKIKQNLKRINICVLI